MPWPVRHAGSIDRPEAIKAAIAELSAQPVPRIVTSRRWAQAGMVVRRRVTSTSTDSAPVPCPPLRRTPSEPKRSNACACRLARRCSEQRARRATRRPRSGSGSSACTEATADLVADVHTLWIEQSRAGGRTEHGVHDDRNLARRSGNSSSTARTIAPLPSMPILMARMSFERSAVRSCCLTSSAESTHDASTGRFVCAVTASDHARCASPELGDDLDISHQASAAAGIGAGDNQGHAPHAGHRATSPPRRGWR